MNAIAHAVAALACSLDSSAALAELSRVHRDAAPALAPYAAPRDILGALAQTSSLMPEERDAIVLALVAQHQATGHPLWQALLLTSYAPMLHGVAARTIKVARGDAQQGAMMAFLSAIASVRIDPAPRLLSLTLRHATERAAFAQSTVCDEPETISLREALRAIDPRDPFDVVLAEEQIQKITRALVDGFGDEAVAREVLEVLVEARASRAALLAYVDATYTSLTRAKRAAMFTRLSRLRGRALRHLARVFDGEPELDVEDAPESFVA